MTYRFILVYFTDIDATVVLEMYLNKWLFESGLWSIVVKERYTWVPFLLFGDRHYSEYVQYVIYNRSLYNQIYTKYKLCYYQGNRCHNLKLFVYVEYIFFSIIQHTLIGF